MSIVNEKIDIVYTWCDDSEPAFYNQRIELLRKLGLPLESKNDQANAEKRYKDNDELLYSLRSVEKYVPWINHIFIITNNQKPSWLNDNPKITIIDHKDIIPKEILPVFNSVAIEQYIIEIPGLSEFFLYLNDDVFFNRKLSPTDFFLCGKPIVYMYPYRFFDFSDKGEWILTLYNAYSAFLSKHKILCPYFSPHHGVDAYSKSILKAIFCEYPELYLLNSTSFRSPENVQRILWSYEMAYRYNCPIRKDYTNISSKAYKLSCLIFHHRFVNALYAGNSDFKIFTLSLRLKRCYSFCLNFIPVDKVSIVKKYLDKRFHKKSEFEK